MPKSCFVISPIGAPRTAIRHHADDVFRFIIEPAMRARGLNALRSDHLSETGRITRQMFREIVRADVCVAVLTGLNPNVFYELAMAQCVARPCILLVEEGQVLPFDIKDLRTIYYRMQPIGQLVDGVFARQVEEQLDDIASRGWIVPSVFQHFDVYPRLRSEAQLRSLVDASRPKPLDPGVHGAYAVPRANGRRLYIDTGDLLEVDRLHGEVVVSPVTTDLQLGRFYDATVSGKLRLLDAMRSPNSGRIERDCMALALDEVVRRENVILPVVAGSVLATPASNLEALGVTHVLHSAALVGTPGDGYEMPPDVIDECIRNAFEAFELLARESPVESLLFPLMGAASSGLGLVEVATRVVRVATSKLASTPACRAVRLMAWNEAQLYALNKAAKELGLEAVPG